MLCSSRIPSQRELSKKLTSVLEHSFPIYELYILAFRSDTGATVLMVASLFMAWFTLNAIYETTSRLIWSFARDNGFLFSRFIGEVNPKLDVPVWAILLNGFVVLVAGCIYLASTTGKYLYEPLAIRTRLLPPSAYS